MQMNRQQDTKGSMQNNGFRQKGFILLDCRNRTSDHTMIAQRLQSYALPTELSREMLLTPFQKHVIDSEIDSFQYF